MTKENKLHIGDAWFNPSNPEKLAQFYGEKVQFKLGDSSDTAQLVSLYAEFTGEGLNNLLKTSENIRAEEIIFF